MDTCLCVCPCVCMCVSWVLGLPSSDSRFDRDRFPTDGGEWWGTGPSLRVPWSLKIYDGNRNDNLVRDLQLCITSTGVPVRLDRRGLREGWWRRDLFLPCRCRLRRIGKEGPSSSGRNRWRSSPSIPVIRSGITGLGTVGFPSTEGTSVLLSLPVPPVVEESVKLWTS